MTNPLGLDDDSWRQGMTEPINAQNAAKQMENLVKISPLVDSLALEKLITHNSQKYVLPN